MTGSEHITSAADEMMEDLRAKLSRAYHYNLAVSFGGILTKLEKDVEELRNILGLRSASHQSPITVGELDEFLDMLSGYTQAAQKFREEVRTLQVVKMEGSFKDGG